MFTEYFAQSPFLTPTIALAGKLETARRDMINNRQITSLIERRFSKILHLFGSLLWITSVLSFALYYFSFQVALII